MKFPVFKSSGHLGLLLTLSVLTTACNQEEYFKAEEFLVGEDAYCYLEGPDLASCLQLVDRCQPAFMASDEDETQEPQFAVCIANRDVTIPVPDESSTTGGSTGGDSSTTGGSTGGDSSTTGGSTGGSTTGGSTTGSTSGGLTDDSDGSVPVVTEPAPNPDQDPLPTIEDAYNSNCSNLDERYLWTKKEVTKKGSKTTSKVKVCHSTGNGYAHSIVIACPALKAHIDHHDDYLGACLP